MSTRLRLEPWLFQYALEGSGDGSAAPFPPALSLCSSHSPRHQLTHLHRHSHPACQSPPLLPPLCYPKPLNLVLSPPDTRSYCLLEQHPTIPPLPPSQFQTGYTINAMPPVFRSTHSPPCCMNQILRLDCSTTNHTPHTQGRLVPTTDGLRRRHQILKRHLTTSRRLLIVKGIPHADGPTSRSDQPGRRNRTLPLPLRAAREHRDSDTPWYSHTSIARKQDVRRKRRSEGRTGYYDSWQME